MEVVTLDRLAEIGAPYGGDLSLACNSELYGADFNLLFLDVEIKKTTEKTPVLYLLNHGCPTFTGWNKGKFMTQASVLAIVLSHSGNIRFYPHNNMPARVEVPGSALGEGWKYYHSAKRGFGGCHQPCFSGEGKMRVAIALPYIGTGNHGGIFVHANSVGRYTHGTDVKTGG